jgi:hypothetical protein
MWEPQISTKDIPQQGQEQQYAEVRPCFSACCTFQHELHTSCWSHVYICSHCRKDVFCLGESKQNTRDIALVNVSASACTIICNMWWVSIFVLETDDTHSIHYIAENYAGANMYTHTRMCENMTMKGMCVCVWGGGHVLACAHLCFWTWPPSPPILSSLFHTQTSCPLMKLLDHSTNTTSIKQCLLASSQTVLSWVLVECGQPSWTCQGRCGIARDESPQCETEDDGVQWCYMTISPLLNLKVPYRFKDWCKILV